MDEDTTSEAARRRAALYDRQPSIWPAPSTTEQSSHPDRAHRATRTVRIVATAAVLGLGPPWLLWEIFGNPVTVASSWWATAPFGSGSATAQSAGLRAGLIWAGWIGWALLATLLAGSLLGVLRGRRLPRWRLPAPLHRLVFGLTGTAITALVTTPATAAFASVATLPHPAALPPAPTLGPLGTVTTEGGNVSADARPAVLAAGDARYEHRVQRGDTLSSIAELWLNNANRWPDICRLNKHRHFPVGGALTDCDLIYPGWELRLPADAVPPPGAKPIPTTDKPHQNPATHPAPAPTNPATAGPGLASPHPTAPPTSSPVDGDRSDAQRRNPGADLVLPGGSVIPWALAAAISATATLVWLQRRRRYVPGINDDNDLQPLPTPVLAAQHHTHDTRTSAHTPPLVHGLPAGGVGLIGAGADAAVRGLIIAALTAGTPTDPDQQTEVIIDLATLVQLLGDTPTPPWRRLHITDTLGQALTLLDTHVLHRARILDEHGLTDLDTLRTTAPAEEALPPLLLITSTELATPSTRARTTFGLTSGLNITVVVLGDWPHGPIFSVTEDGHTASTPTHVTADGRLAVLDPETTLELLTTTREAHTGEPPHPGLPAGATAQSPEPATKLRTTAPPISEPAAGVNEPEQSIASPDQPPPAADNEPRSKVRLRVLGTPAIENITLPGRDLRRRAAELAVYLACNPDGADTDTIAEHLVPDVRHRQANQLIHTDASNLRHVLGRAGGPLTGGYVLKRGANARYRLDPTTVAVDLWQLRDLLTRAQLASAPTRIELLREACDLYTAPLAEGCDYEWVEPHRENVRRLGTQAHLLLADDLLESDPQAASDLLGNAIGMDRYNEELYRKAMYARHALRDADGIRTLLRALTKALADLDAEPAEATTELAAHLRASLEQR